VYLQARPAVNGPGSFAYRWGRCIIGGITGPTLLPSLRSGQTASVRSNQVQALPGLKVYLRSARPSSPGFSFPSDAASLAQDARLCGNGVNQQELGSDRSGSRNSHRVALVKEPAGYPGGFLLRFATEAIYDGAINLNREYGRGDRYCEVVQRD